MLVYDRQGFSYSEEITPSEGQIFDQREEEEDGGQSRALLAN
jgi:hypothetical protein